jgi:ABC-type Mn2+/Zn2+ transport system permease subunit
MMWQTLTEPLHYGFLRNALVVCTVAGALCGLLGVFVTLRSMSYIGHGLSHAIFGGAAICAAIGINFFVGAGVWGLASGLAVGRISRRRAIAADAAIGVITTASFAFGIALLGVSALAAVVVVGFYRPLLFTTFDPEVAEVSGVNIARVDAILMLLLSLAILASMKVLGVTLIAAALVIPPVAARLLTNSFKRMLVLSTAIGALSGFVGMYLSYFLDVSSGATIVLVNFVAFASVYAVTGVKRVNHRPVDRPVSPSGRFSSLTST